MVTTLTVVLGSPQILDATADPAIDLSQIRVKFGSNSARFCQSFAGDDPGGGSSEKKCAARSSI
jgi:hypothetical protein